MNEYMRIRECKHHGEYIQTGEYTECPICGYYYYLEFLEDEEREKDEDK